MGGASMVSHRFPASVPMATQIQAAPLTSTNAALIRAQLRGCVSMLLTLILAFATMATLATRVHWKSMNVDQTHV